MSETALKGSLASSPSSSPPPPTFSRLGSRSKVIAKQYDAALALASTADSSVDDLCKIIWGQRRFVIASLLDKRKKLRKDNTSSGDIWCCRLCDDKGAPRFFNAQSTSSASAHLFKAHGITETFEAGSSGDSSVIDLQRNASKKRPASSSFLLPRAKMTVMLLDWRQLLLLWQTYLNSPLTSYTMATISSYFGPGSGRRPHPERVILDPTYLNPRPNDHDGILIGPDEFERNGKQYVRCSVR
ncbi:hypothetical protein FOQG_17895 [Fusarium oxysporum f. sp. raphani 54005]|uniref:Uncharacterized protein n=1 Tax=Fusarium oxysporum f. sp. raphani 54005 TaxID=1089458 RepID=X0BEX2_FUSOX|nr:hypothetical protein FOQG_17895 [Fusarium oxysporum f. sp. raphani 54005]